MNELLNNLRKNNTPSIRKKITSKNDNFKNRTFKSILSGEESIETSNLKIIGITGSKGKSSSAFILHNCLKNAGYKSILYSSICIDDPLSYISSDDAIENPLKNEVMLLDALENALSYEADFLIIEVNERAISRGLTKNIPFDVRVITNIIPGQNQIFFNNYAEIKKTFFSEATNNPILITFLNNQISKQMAIDYKDKNLITYSSNYICDAHNIDKTKVNYLINSSERISTIDGLNFNINDLNINSNFVFPYSSINITCVYAILNALKVYDEDIFKASVSNITIPGRDEVIRWKNRTIIISILLAPQLEILKDYQNLKMINKIRLIVGASGLGYKTWEKEYSNNVYLEEKEKGIRFAYNYLKKFVDKVYITNSDVGASSKEGLIDFQASLLHDEIEYEKHYDRYEAIKKAIEDSNENDVIYISGRGNRRIMCSSYDTITSFLDSSKVKEIIEEYYD